MTDQVDKLVQLHYDLIIEFGGKQITDWNKVKEVMMRYNKEDVDINELKTVLVLTSGFKEKNEIKELRKEMVNLLDIKLKSYDKR